MLRIQEHVDKGHRVTIAFTDRNRLSMIAYCETGEDHIIAHKMLGEPYPEGTCVNDDEESWYIYWDIEDTLLTHIRNDLEVPKNG
jgi:hypothetical protein